MFRQDRGEVGVLIGHPGGPFWVNKDEGAWSIPKGLVEAGEETEQAARREFQEETGLPLGSGAMIPLGSVVLKSRKEVVAWAVSGVVDPDATTSNMVTMEWPRGSGRLIEFPEIDRLLWCSVAEAEIRLNPAQRPFLSRLTKWLDRGE
jgi:predicted NUDIX family NTP pyrophosphohydrolase